MAAYIIYKQHVFSIFGAGSSELLSRRAYIAFVPGKPTHHLAAHTPQGLGASIARHFALSPTEGALENSVVFSAGSQRKEPLSLRECYACTTAVRAALNDVAAHQAS